MLCSYPSFVDLVYQDAKEGSWVSCSWRHQHAKRLGDISVYALALRRPIGLH